MELVLGCLILELLNPRSLVFFHKVIVFKVEIIFKFFIQLLFVEVFPIVVLLDLLLLGLEDLLASGGDVFSWFPVAFGYVDIFPL
jgi:hypothetical protein